MRLYLLAAAIAVPAFIVPAFTVPVWAQEKAPLPPKPFGSAAEVQSLLAKLRAHHKPVGATDEIIATAGPYSMELEYRTASTPPGLHKGNAEMVYVVAGSCTLVTGGSLVNPVDKGANISGTAIADGHSQVLKKGDYALIPSNTPHWFNDVRGEFAIATMHMPMPAQ